MSAATTAPGAGAEPRRLGYYNTTVSPRNRALGHALDPWRQTRADQLQAKGLELKAAALEANDWNRFRQAGQWHLARAAGLRRNLAERLCDCGQRVAELVDAATGEVRQVPIGCGQVVCKVCRKRRAQKVSARIRASLEGINEAERRRHRHPALWTLTMRDPPGQPGLAAVIMRDAWKLLRSRWYAQFGWSFRFCRYEELTPGTSGQGHLHWHAVVWHFRPGKKTLSRWQKWWRQALRTAARRAGYAGDIGGNLDVSPSRGPAEAALAYASKLYKYICKEDLDLQRLDTDLAVSYLTATYTLRRMTTSRYLLRQAEHGPKRFYLVAVRCWREGDDIDPREVERSLLHPTGPPA